MPIRDKLIDLFKTSALIQGVMALAGFGVICYLAIIGRPIPEILAALVGTIVGYYFGTKTKQST
ncbi:hypothetical protein ES703_66973 [subsurface metagenome]